MHDLDGAPSSLIGDLTALAVRCGDGRAARQRHPKRLRQRVHGRGRAHGVAVADRRRRRRYEVDEFGVAHAPGRMFLTPPPHHCARAGALALPPTVEHRSPREDDGREVHGRGGHDPGGGGLVAAGREHDAVKRIAEQHFDKAEIGKIAV